jgi:hypothetical protein
LRFLRGFALFWILLLLLFLNRIRIRWWLYLHWFLYFRLFLRLIKLIMLLKLNLVGLIILNVFYTQESVFFFLLLDRLDIFVFAFKRVNKNNSMGIFKTSPRLFQRLFLFAFYINSRRRHLFQRRWKYINSRRKHSWFEFPLGAWSWVSLFTQHIKKTLSVIIFSLQLHVFFRLSFYLFFVLQYHVLYPIFELKYLVFKSFFLCFQFLIKHRLMLD